MNKYVDNSFKKIKGAAAAFERETTEALKKYSQTMDAARKKAREYKDEDGHIAGARAGAVTTARNTITTAKNDFAAVVGAEIKTLRDELNRHVAAVPSSNFVDLAKIYNDFNINPTRMELDNLVAHAGNNTLALRVLNTVLEKVKSRYRIEYQDTTELEADIAALEGLTEQPMYSPDGLHPAAVDVFGGTIRLVRLVTGEPLADHGFTWDNTSIITASTAFEAAVAGLDPMSERWNTSVPPKIYDTKIYADHRDEQTGAEISGSGAEEFVRDNTAPTGRVVEDQDAGTKLAGEIAKRAAAEGAKAREVLGMYK